MPRRWEGRKQRHGQCASFPSGRTLARFSGNLNLQSASTQKIFLVTFEPISRKAPQSPILAPTLSRSLSRLLPTASHQPSSSRTVGPWHDPGSPARARCRSRRSWFPEPSVLALGSLSPCPPAAAAPVRWDLQAVSCAVFCQKSNWACPRAVKLFSVRLSGRPYRH